jgi:hypothetical protein
MVGITQPAQATTETGPSQVQILPARPLNNAVSGKILASFTQIGCVD